MQLSQQLTCAGPAAPLSARAAGSASHRQSAAGRPASAAAVVGSWDLDAHRSNLAMAGSRIPEGSAVNGTSAGRPARPMSPVPGEPCFSNTVHCVGFSRQRQLVSIKCGGLIQLLACVSLLHLSKEQAPFTGNRQLSKSGPCRVYHCTRVWSQPAGPSGSHQDVVAAHSMHSNVWDRASLLVLAHSKHAVAALAADFHYNDMTPRSNMTSTDPGTSRRPHSAAATTHRVSACPPEGCLDREAWSLQLLLITACVGHLLSPAGHLAVISARQVHRSSLSQVAFR